MTELMKPLCPVILAGGGGTRLWPLSREHYPKQFLSFGQEHSMLQQTLIRVFSGNSEYEINAPVIICNEEHRFLVAEHALRTGITLAEIILEPVGRNTAPALTIAALRVLDQDPVLLISPADHLIADTGSFHKAIADGYAHALQDRLVIFGIQPTAPETGFGYIRAGKPITGNDYSVDAFVEKPDAATAAMYLAAGNYYWNSGIFMMKASVWLKAIDRYRPDIHQACIDLTLLSATDGVFFRLANSFRDCPADSIDYAVMEKVCADKGGNDLAMVSMNAGWSDLGSWSAIYDISSQDNDGNVILGNVFTHNTSNSIVQSHDRLVATFGCDDLLVIETSDAVLIGNRSNAQDVKHIVSRLNENKRSEAVSHRRVYRPWGSYESLDSGECYQVKRLVVNPGKKLSLQLHNRRAEHWVVVQGTATVTCEDRIFDLKVNESTYIPLGAKHRLENRHSIPLEVIEVQSGDYLGEDDIVRLNDDFGRHNSVS